MRSARLQHERGCQKPAEAKHVELAACWRQLIHAAVGGRRKEYMTTGTAREEEAAKKTVSREFNQLS